MASKAQELRVLHLRLPKDLYDQITRLADEEERPINTQIARMLREMLGTQRTPVVDLRRRA